MHNIASYIDHTALKPTLTLADADRLCAEARTFGFAAVCIPPPFVRRTRSLLEGSLVKTATVIGFPFGYSAIEAKVSEVLLAIVDGADELDMVINLVALKNNDWEYLAGEIGTILPLVHGKGKVLKVIVESGVLTRDELIRCCELYGAAGIDYLKTSTGYAETGATVEAVEIMQKHLPSSVHIKASGGIRTFAQAKTMIDAGATRIGTSAGVAIVQPS
ncbi:deoxyribose-phosphate aldolase [Dinghuibacter silviterrae]|uniref:Deoxyribose-phosphate aldolase n=1 Tax=Dinghuibacter silviterrae TaxID=1539049 RepID=A0A4R8DME9_9BACT|nr:deoxyribose-phosphate aldolase [Dinghuibacter silviterrae]TDW99159.1 deoxyribose-phosphate aldolase [Dinghuibacter silviterrae]